MKLIRWLGIGLLSLLLLPIALFVGTGLVRGHDIGSAWRALITSEPDFTIDAGQLERAAFADAVYVGNVERVEIEEASGLAPSRRRSDLLWALNDSGAGARLYALGVDGRDLGTVDVPGATNFDWEDLASFTLDGMPYLLIADVGDNFSWRRRVQLYVVEEPELRAERFEEGATARLAWVIPLRYEDGPRDSEAVAVDVPRRRVLILSKRSVPLELYEVDLMPPKAPEAAPRVAARVTEVPNIPQPTEADREEDPEFGESRSLATAMDVAPDASELVIVTYKNAYHFPRADGESWSQALVKLPRVIPVPPMEQIEAGTYSRDARSFFITTEQRPSPLFRIDRKEVHSPDPAASRSWGTHVGSVWQDGAVIGVSHAR